MKVNYLIDVSKDSFSLSHTPSLQSQRLPFYIHGGGHFFAQSSYFTEREGLDNYLLIYTLSGKGYLNYNGSNYYLEPNQVVIFYCEEPQFYKTDSHSWEFKWIHLNGTAIKEYYSIINGDSPSVVSMGKKNKLNERIDEIFHSVSSDSLVTNIRISSIITDILTEVIVSKHSALNNKKHLQHKAETDKVIAYIQENYNKKIGMNDLTNLVFISKYHFLRLFKVSTGLSPYEYLINYRINISKSLLKTTDLTVSEICYRVGFSDNNNFIRYFKRLVGVTPSYYRKNWII